MKKKLRILSLYVFNDDKTYIGDGTVSFSGKALYEHWQKFSQKRGWMIPSPFENIMCYVENYNASTLYVFFMVPAYESLHVSTTTASSRDKSINKGIQEAGSKV